MTTSSFTRSAVRVTFASIALTALAAVTLWCGFEVEQSYWERYHGAAQWHATSHSAGRIQGFEEGRRAALRGHACGTEEVERP